jgi:hypothetical protein
VAWADLCWPPAGAAVQPAAGEVLYGADSKAGAITPHDPQTGRPTGAPLPAGPVPTHRRRAPWFCARGGDHGAWRLLEHSSGEAPRCSARSLPP